jgi:hypothetical protein
MFRPLLAILREWYTKKHQSNDIKNRTYSRGLHVSWDANSRPSIQEIPCTLRNPNFIIMFARTHVRIWSLFWASFIVYFPISSTFKTHVAITIPTLLRL